MGSTPARWVVVDRGDVTSRVDATRPRTLPSSTHSVRTHAARRSGVDPMAPRVAANRHAIVTRARPRGRPAAVDQPARGTQRHQVGLQPR